MNVYFGQVYIEPKARLPFTTQMQHYLSSSVTSLVSPSVGFIEQYGEDYNVVFNISAKCNTSATEIKGPSVFGDTKDVEYTLFLPFDALDARNICGSAIQLILAATCKVLEELEMDTARLQEREPDLIEEILRNPAMMEGKRGQP